ncbi:MAG TPA: putative toxin-antitoxin system toxin component, PIN family [Candidatus Angelobacter sp.]|jgi:putative PIN family toxin of toxin-antitoxin system
MPRPSVVLDTNIIVSAHLKEDGLERSVLDLALARKIRLLLSAEILEEYKGVLARPVFKFDPEKVAASLELIEKTAIKVRPEKTVTVSKDPDDNKFLECAEQAEADYLVTGNKKHFPAQWRKSKIVNARELLQEIIPDLKR